MRYEVIVGNIGSVCRTANPAYARKIYGEYKLASIGVYGRASGESVTLIDHIPDLGDSEIVCEHVGEVDHSEV
jgi:hypothetical protein